MLHAIFFLLLSSLSLPFSASDLLSAMDFQHSSNEGNTFEVQLNASYYGDFKASEIGVNVVDGAVDIIGKQGWRPHPGGSHRREFVHRMMLPRDVNTEQLAAYMTHDGYVVVRAPRLTGQRKQVVGHETRLQVLEAREPCM